MTIFKAVIIFDTTKFSMMEKIGSKIFRSSLKQDVICINNKTDWPVLKYYEDMYFVILRIDFILVKNIASPKFNYFIPMCVYMCMHIYITYTYVCT